MNNLSDIMKEENELLFIEEHFKMFSGIFNIYFRNKKDKTFSQLNIEYNGGSMLYNFTTKDEFDFEIGENNVFGIPQEKIDTGSFVDYLASVGFDDKVVNLSTNLFKFGKSFFAISKKVKGVPMNVLVKKIPEECLGPFEKFQKKIDYLDFVLA